MDHILLLGVEYDSRPTAFGIESEADSAGRECGQGAGTEMFWGMWESTWGFSETTRDGLSGSLPHSLPITSQ